MSFACKVYPTLLEEDMPHYRWLSLASLLSHNMSTPKYVGLFPKSQSIAYEWFLFVWRSVHSRVKSYVRRQMYIEVVNKKNFNMIRPYLD